MHPNTCVQEQLEVTSSVPLLRLKRVAEVLVMGLGEDFTKLIAKGEAALERYDRQELWGEENCFVDARQLPTSPFWITVENMKFGAVLRNRKVVKPLDAARDPAEGSEARDEVSKRFLHNLQRALSCALNAVIDFDTKRSPSGFITLHETLVRVEQLSQRMAEAKSPDSPWSSRLAAFSRHTLRSLSAWYLRNASDLNGETISVPESSEETVDLC